MKGYFRKWLIGLLAVVIVVVGMYMWARHGIEQNATQAFNQSSIVQAYLGDVTIEELSISQFSPMSNCQDSCEHYLVKLKGQKGSAAAVMDFGVEDTELSYAILCLADGTNIALTKDAEAIVQNNRGETPCQ